MSELTEAQARLVLVQAAYDKALSGLTVVYGEKRITRHNIDVLRDEMSFWQNKVDQLTSSSAGVQGGVLLPKWT